MPPRRRQRAANGPAGGGAVAAAQTSPLLALPPDVFSLIGQGLAVQDKLSNIATCARDIASLAKACKTLRQVAESTLWGLLGEGTPAVGAATASKLPGIASEHKWEGRFLSHRARKLGADPKPKELATAYAEDVPDAVPAQVFAEAARLRNLGLAGTNAKEEFLLTEGELKELPRTDKSRGSLGTTHLYALTDVLALARAKHGDPAGLAAAREAKAAKGAARKEKAKDKGEAKVDALRQAVAQRGGTLSPTLLQVERVRDFLRKGGASGTPPERLLAFLDLLSWSERYAGYAGMRKELVTSESRWMGFKVMYRDEGEGSYFNDYYGEAFKAAATLSDHEDEDCVRLALQLYAERHGGVSAALSRPEVPPEGAPLRAQIAAAMRQRISTGILFDLPGYDPYIKDAMLDSEEGFSEDDAEAAEREGAEGSGPALQAGAASGPGSGGAGPAAQGPGVEPTPFFQRGYHRYVQVKATAANGSAADLEAWQRWLAGRLGWLVRRITSYGSRQAEACPQAFRPPAGEEPGGGNDNGGATCCFFIGVSFCQPPSSLYNGSGASGSGDGGREDEGEALARGVEAAALRLTQRAQRWQGPPGGVQLTLLPAGEVPGWAADAGAADDAA